MGNSTSTNSNSVNATSNNTNTNISSSTLTPNDKLLLEYDKIFNRTNKKFNNINREIEVKTRLVDMNMGVGGEKRELISILQSVFLFLILSFFIVWFYLSGLIGLVPTIIIIAVILVIVIYRFVKSQIYNIENKIASVSTETGDNLRKTFEEAYLNITGVGDYTCQEYCPQESEGESEEPSVGQVIPRTRPRYIREDSQRDVWLKGDLPDSTYTINDKNKRYRIDGEYIRGYGYDNNLYISPGGIKNYRSTIGELEENSPQTREIIPISKKYGTYYSCKFLGGNQNKNKVPYKTSYKHTTIPCDNYPGFVETAKYICPDDPQKYGLGNCKKVPKKVNL